MEDIFEKRMITEKEARGSVSLNGQELSRLVVEGNCVRFSIQAASWAYEGEELFVFDYRPEVIQAAKRMPHVEVSFEYWWKCKKALEKAINQPAKVVVMEVVNKRVNEAKCEYVELYPPRDQEPTTLFFKRTFVSEGHQSANEEDNLVGYEILEDNSHWSWRSRSVSRTGLFQELVIVGLSDDEHRIIVKCWDRTMINPFVNDKKWVTLIGREISLKDLRAL